jgi:hypothetical protein
MLDKDISASKLLATFLSKTSSFVVEDSHGQAELLTAFWLIHC